MNPINGERTAVAVTGLTKDFHTDFWKPKVRALQDVTFSVPEGGIFGLIGHNGAGKTTVIKILIGLIRPTSGAATIFGRVPSDPIVKSSIGYLPENAYYYDFLTAAEVLDFYGKLFNLTSAERKSRSKELLDLVGLSKHAHLKLRNFSKGMLQRVGIAQAIVNDPKCLILDEPMTGLDPIGRKEMRDIILHLAERGKTIIFSSHILTDVESICDNVALLVKGQLAAAGSLATLVNARIRSVDIAFQGQSSVENPPTCARPGSLRRVGDQVLLAVDGLESLPEALDWGRKAGLTLLSVVPHRESLEDLFIEKTAGGR